MISVRIGVMVPVVVAVIMPMVIMAVAVTMIVAVVMAVDVAAVARPDPLNMMVMTLLRETLLSFEAEDLLAVFAEFAVHQVLLVAQQFHHPLSKRIQHPRMVVQITNLHEIDVCVAFSHAVGVLVNAPYKNAGEQEIGEHQYALEPEARRPLQTRLYQWEGHAGIAGLSPTEAEPFPQQTRDLGDV